MYGPSYSLDYDYSLEIFEGAGIEVYGETPEGIRVHAFLNGGTVTASSCAASFDRLAAADSRFFASTISAISTCVCAWKCTTTR